MDLEELFANKNKQQKYQYKREYGYQKQPQFNWLSIYDKIKQNQKLRNIIIIGIAIILIIVIGLIVILFPFIVKIFNYIAEKEDVSKTRDLDLCLSCEVCNVLFCC